MTVATPRARAILLVFVLALAAVAPGPRAAEAQSGDYSVASVDVNGNPFGGGWRQWVNYQQLARYSLSDDGTKVAFARARAVADGYAPVTHDEFCLPYGICRDLYIRDLTTGVTVPVVGRFEVGNADERSFPTVASEGGQWAVSADMRNVVFSWVCWGEQPEMIGDTEICGPGHDRWSEQEALVVLDRDSGAAEVISTAVVGASGDLDMAADGDTVLYTAFGEFPGHCLRADWVCYEDGDDLERMQVLRVWRRGAGSTSVSVQFGSHYPDDDSPWAMQWYVKSAALSGDGSKVFLLVEASHWREGEDAYHLFVYDVGTGALDEVALPYQNYPDAKWWWLSGASRDGETVMLTVDGPSALIEVRVASGVARQVPGAVCQHASWSVAADARHVGCWRVNAADEMGHILPPAVVDTVTGQTTEIATRAEGFSTASGYVGPRLNADGSRAVFLGNREGQSPQIWVATLDPAALPPRADSPACPADRVPASGFADTGGNTHRHPIDCLAWWEVTGGVSPGVYGPALPVRRDQMASFLVRVILNSGGTLPPPSAHPGFGDTAGNTHEDNIRRLAAAGVVLGTSPTTYAPDLTVRREQMATFLVRAHEYRTAETLSTSRAPFADIAGSGHRESIDKAAEAGFAAGTTTTTFEPARDVRRDQMASFLTRVLDHLVEHGHATPPG